MDDDSLRYFILGIVHTHLSVPAFHGGWLWHEASETLLVWSHLDELGIQHVSVGLLSDGMRIEWRLVVLRTEHAEKEEE